MSPNPEAMSSISPANGIRYHMAEDDRSYKKSAGSSRYGSFTLPKESYKLTEDSINKLKSFCGQNGENHSIKIVYSEYEEVRKLNELAKILERVEECPWYWGNLDGPEAKKVLAGTDPGTFLLRLSSDPKYLFSLSVKTRFGPTSIRIVYENGYFRFDSEVNGARSQPRSSNDPTHRKGHPNYVHRTTRKFTCVIHLVLYYTRHLLQGSNDTDALENGEDRPGELFMCYWVSRNGRREIPVLLSTPLPKKRFFPSLQSLCRTALSKEHELWYANNLEVLSRKDMPVSIRRFIKQYPYPV